MDGGVESERFLPSIRREQKMDRMIVHFGLTFQVAGYHFPYWGCSVCGKKGGLARAWILGKIEDMILKSK